MRRGCKAGSVISGLALMVMTGCSGLPGMMDIDSVTTEKTTEAVTTEAVTETEAVTTEAVTETEESTEAGSYAGQDAIWAEFIQSGKYRDYTGKCFSTARDGVMQTLDDLDGFKYTLYDLDGDGVNELILEADASGAKDIRSYSGSGEPDNDNFHFEWTFGIDGNGDIVQADSNVGYGDMRYSEKYSALVAIPGTRPSQNMAYWAFLTYENCSVSVQFTVLRQDGQEVLRRGSEEEDISGQFDEYMSTCQDFDWIPVDSEGGNSSDGQDASADTEEQTEAATEAGSTSASALDLCDGYWTQYGQQSWLIKFASDGTAKVYNMIGIMENTQGGSISDSDIVSDVSYSFDGSNLTLNGFAGGSTVTLALHTQDETPGYMTDKQRGTGNVFFYEDGYDSSDPMGEPVVIGSADTSDSMVSAAIDWAESR